MKTMKTVVHPAVPERAETVVDEILCEICGKPCGTGEYDSTIDHVSVKHVVGNNYGADGVYSTTTFIDLCPDCFDNKLVPWIIRWNGQPRTEEKDF